jgi:hypothetical protein
MKRSHTQLREFTLPRDKEGKTYYILEHPRKGTCVGTGQNEPGDRPWPRFTWFTSRKGRKVVQWDSLADIIEFVEQLGKTDWPGAWRLRIRKAPRFYWRCWDCGGWIDDQTLPYERGHKSDCPTLSDK